MRSIDALLKNIELSKAFNLEDLVEYKSGQVISRTLAQGQSLSLTLIAFDQGEETEPHTSPADAMVYVLDGRADILIGENRHILEKGKIIVMPAEIPHAFQAIERFKILLVVLFPME